MIIAPTTSSDYFTWPGNVGVADVTDPGISHIIGKRYYDDAADVGFRVRSERTGISVPFFFLSPKLRADRELVADVYESACGRFEIHILND